MFMLFVLTVLCSGVLLYLGSKSLYLFWNSTDDTDTNVSSLIMGGLLTFLSILTAAISLSYVSVL